MHASVECLRSFLGALMRTTGNHSAVLGDLNELPPAYVAGNPEDDIDEIS